MVRDLKAAKKHYISPSFEVLDVGAAKAELEIAGSPDDATARTMLSVIEKRLEVKIARAGSPEPGPLPKTGS